jgi:hypothetical protein
MDCSYGTRSSSVLRSTFGDRTPDEAQSISSVRDLTSRIGTVVWDVKIGVCNPQGCRRPAAFRRVLPTLDRFPPITDALTRPGRAMRVA